MKIVAGLGSIDEYIPYVEAGADELFCGYVPAWWNEKYGTLYPLNRREVLSYNVQIGAFEDLKIMKEMIRDYGIRVKLAMNSLYYSGEQYKEIAEIIMQCMNIGYDTFIIADPALILYLREHKIDCKIHLSGEMSEVNFPFIKQMSEFEIARVIFHRKNTIEDMKSCILNGKNLIPEYEAFVLNEMCHYTGAYCNSLHCDELSHICHVPYKLGNYSMNKNQQKIQIVQKAEKDIEETEDVVGATGCGLCALKKLEKAGITHLKLVGRGNYTENMKRDILALRRSLDILEDSNQNNESEEKFSSRIRNELFYNRCSNNCYYR